LSALLGVLAAPLMLGVSWPRMQPNDSEVTIHELEEESGIKIEHVLGQIDAEITRLRAEASAAGWTPWLLALSIGTILGLLAAVWDHGQVMPVRAACWFMTIWIVADAVVPWFSGDATRQFGAFRTTPLRARWDFRIRLPFIVFALLRYLLMVAIAFATWGHVSEVLYHGKFLANTPLMVASTYTVIAGRLAYLLWCGVSPQRARGLSVDGEWVRVFGPIEAFSILLIILPGAYVFSGAGGYPEAGQPLPGSLKAGALMAVLLYLLLQLVDVTCRPRLIGDLVQVRRNLVSARLRPEEALERVEGIVPSGPSSEDTRIIAFR
jgi:hypothetical protein